MSREFRSGHGPTSPAYDFFQLMFEAADAVSLIWQPFLKGVGRYQLEMAQLGARQSRALIESGHTKPFAGNPLMSMPLTPMALLETQARLWNQFGDMYLETGRNVARAADQAVIKLPAQPQSALQSEPQVKAEAPKKPERDVMRLEEWVGWMDDDALERRRAA